MPKEVYAFVHKEDVVAKSASGGAFSAIAEAFFNTNTDRDRWIFGVTLNQNMEVVYESADTLVDCEKFKGSKYVRSDMRGVPQRIAELLQNGSAVLFVGTPCFVYALKSKLSQLNVEMNKLLCVDLICHGTPERKYWEAYKKWLETKGKGRLIQFLFRTHIPGKSPYTAVAEFSNGRKMIGTLETAVFNRLFLRHYILSEGCFACRFASLERQGDLTIGDFWGIDQVMPEFGRKFSVSEILVNTDKGLAVAQWICENTEYQMEKCIGMDFVKYQNNLQRPAEKPADFEQFSQDFQKKGMEYVAKKYVGYDFLHRMKAKLLSK